MEKFVPVVVIKELSETDKILKALKNNGINTAEITFRTACAAEAISYACKNYPEMSIGAGTVINAEQCKAALDAGAQFIVSPGLSVSVANICKENISLTIQDALRLQKLCRLLNLESLQLSSSLPTSMADSRLLKLSLLHFLRLSSYLQVV